MWLQLDSLLAKACALESNVSTVFFMPANKDVCVYVHTYVYAHDIFGIYLQS